MSKHFIVLGVVAIGIGVGACSQSPRQRRERLTRRPSR